MLLPINLGKVIRLFSINLESIILQRERLFTAARLLKTKPLISTVKHSGGGVMIWACFAATGPAVIESVPQNSRVKCELICQIYDDARDRFHHTELHYFKSLMLKVALQATESWDVLKSFLHPSLAF